MIVNYRLLQKIKLNSKLQLAAIGDIEGLFHVPDSKF